MAVPGDEVGALSASASGLVLCWKNVGVGSTSAVEVGAVEASASDVVEVGAVAASASWWKIVSEEVGAFEASASDVVEVGAGAASASW